MAAGEERVKEDVTSWPRIYFSRAMDDQSPADILASARTLEARLVERRLRLVDPYVPGEVPGPAVVEADLDLLKSADAVLMDMSIPNRNYVGCVSELVYAYLWDKPAVVFVGDSGNGGRLWLRYHAREITEDFDEALALVEKHLHTR